MGVSMNPSVGCPEGLSWEHGAGLNFSELPGACGMNWYVGKQGGRWGSWERLLISVEGRVGGGRA